MVWRELYLSLRHAKARDRFWIGCGLLLAGWALFPLVVVFIVMFARASLPFDLEWCEGGSMYQAYRVLHGLPLYARTDTNWAPFPYPPAHTLLLAVLGVVRLDFWIGRVASILFFSGMCVVLGNEVFREATSKAHGAVAALSALAVVACAYPVVGQWYDLVRVDSMMMLLCVWGTSRVLKERTRGLPVIATALLFTVALFTKQTSIFFVAWACLFAIIRRPKLGAAISLATLFATLALLGIAQWVTHGGFWFWVITNLAKQPVSPGRLTLGITTVIRFAPFIVAIPVAAVALAVRKALSPRTMLWTGSLFASIPASLLPFAKSGGYLNNLMPMLVLVGPVTMLLVVDIANVNWRVSPFIVRWLPMAAMAAFVALNPLSVQTYLPSSGNIRAAEKLNTFVRELPGGVVVPYFAFLPARNGHTNPHWHRMAALDAYYRGDSMNEGQIFERIGARWALIQSADPGPFEAYVRRHFKRSLRLTREMRPRTITGAIAAVDELWERQ